ncbi:aminodeoxychorismate synthase component I [Aestuariispira insulae]|uniref:aminodeoxychorismate synthase n=1 Tax=Aestuariispira insulae TaxID=1461337 RepID=A0A3D9HJM1_9PROT|nr:aminodeoxychorismate synthase component I [Aestuariispira insulae]RED49690.1 aminodeoxychorismate synthase subunit I [Aestuariispira insulae]
MSLPAVIKEIPFVDPADIFPDFADLSHALFLDSAMVDPRLGGVSYITADPYRVIEARDDAVLVDGSPVTENPFDILKKELSAFPLERDPNLPAFQGGAAGLFGYDLGWCLENLPDHQADDMSFSPMAVGLFDVVLAFDHNAQKAWVISTGFPETEEKARLEQARKRASWFLKRLKTAGRQGWPAMIMPPLTWQSSDSQAGYEAKVQKVIDYIYAGDIFQANLSQRFHAPLPENFSPLAFYKHLRQMNAATFCGYFDTGDGVIASSSPERFLKVEAGRVETRPIKGTRGRSNNPEEDRALAADLLASDKDRAENVMIVDLLRNDLSKVCAPHTVAVPELCALESYASVHHLVSAVVGALKPGKDAVDLLAASFPGGSITGAPKVRAMEIIAELEPKRRGPYCGSLGYVSFAGDMDTSILIRTLAIKDRQVAFQAGGGIVADSDPRSEYEETLVKAKRLFEAFDAMSSGRSSFADIKAAG